MDEVHPSILRKLFNLCSLQQYDLCSNLMLLWKVLNYSVHLGV